MSAHVLLNLLNELGKRDKMYGLPSILLLFRDKFNKFNNTDAQMLELIDHMTLKLIKNHIFGMKTSRFCHLSLNIIMNVITFPNICKPLVVFRFYCIALYHSLTRRNVIKMYKLSPTE